MAFSSELCACWTGLWPHPLRKNCISISLPRATPPRRRNPYSGVHAGPSLILHISVRPRRDPPSWFAPRKLFRQLGQQVTGEGFELAASLLIILKIGREDVRKGKG